MDFQGKISKNNIVDAVRTVMMPFLYGNIAILFIHIENLWDVSVVGDGDPMMSEDLWTYLVKFNKGNCIFHDVIILRTWINRRRFALLLLCFLEIIPLIILPISLR
jgi:hypothetical protein